MTNVPEMVGSL